jgi:hypothetical protein
MKELPLRLYLHSQYVTPGEMSLIVLHSPCFSILFILRGGLGGVSVLPKRVI